MQESSKSDNFKLLKPWPKDQHWGPKEGSKFSIEVYRENVFKKFLLKNYNATVCEITLQVSPNYEILNLEAVTPRLILGPQKEFKV